MTALLAELVEGQEGPHPMSDDDPITRREAQTLTQSIRDLTNELRELRNDIAETYVRKDVIDPTLKLVTDAIAAVSGRVSKLESGMNWVIRLVLSVVIVAVLGLVITKGGGG